MNGTQNKKSVAATIGTTYYGNNGRESVALATRFYGNTMVIGIHPLLPESKQTQNSKYDYKSGIEMYLRPKACKTLARLLKQAVYSRAKGEKIKSKSIPTGSNLIEVCRGEKYGCEEGSIAIVAHKDIDPETKKPAILDIFAFKDDIIISEFDPQEGVYTSEKIDVDVDYLIDQLEDFARGMSNGYIHAMKKENKYDMDRIISNQLLIMNSLGIKNDTAVGRADWSTSGDSDGSVIYSTNTSDLINEINNM
jgi:hypothetical protein